ncbi:MAG TPA: hypothetical protein VND66_10805 [Acidobacteriaceae bacterium]|nr:hypothetical protein [Terriglobia bacterium]HVC91098.1 hypothetical protein [Acidobacteriaceae bacterium]
MAWDESFTCDICGTAKLESNHWWMVTLGNVLCFEEDQPARHFTLLPWDNDESRNPKVHHICGEGCATKALERFMSSGNLAPEGSKFGTRAEVR